MNAVQITHITKDYGNSKGIFDVSLSVKKGEVYGFLGPNGAGKTTTIRHLLGFLKPEKGECLINGMDCFCQASLIQKNLGYLAGEIAFPEDFTGHGLLHFLADMKGIRDRSRMKELIDLLELDPSGKVRKMSKGMKQKLGIINAFMGNPEIVILDEPTSGLDPLMQNRFVELVEEEKNKGKTIFLSSHIFEEVEKTCDRVGILRGGKLIRDITIDELRSSQMTTYQIGFSDVSDLRRFQRQYPDAHCAKNALQLTISIPDSQINPLIGALSQCGLRFLREEKHTLEEYFMQFYGGEEHV